LFRNLSARIFGDITLVFLDQRGEQDPGTGSYANADAWSTWPGGVFGGCRIRLFADFTAASPDRRNQILAHEIFHCFQLDAYRTIEAYATAPRWVIEGQAEWVAVFYRQVCALLDDAGFRDAALVAGEARLGEFFCATATK
jgi:hypothetical protein